VFPGHSFSAPQLPVGPAKGGLKGETLVSKTGDQGARDTICAALGLAVPQVLGPKGQKLRMSPVGCRSK
jgi:hypothetical protein